MKRSSEQRLHVFEMACLRSVLGITRRDRMHNDDIKHHLHLQKEAKCWIQQGHLRYFGHVMKVNGGTYLKIALLRKVQGIR